MLAHNRRRLVVAGTVAAVAALIAGAAVLATGLGDDKGPSPARAAQEEASVGERYRTLRKTLTSVPGWAVTDAAVETTAMNRCEGGWGGPGGRFAGHNLGLSVSPDEPPVAWAEEIEGFTSPAQASDAMDRLIANLTSCTAESWRSQPIGQTGAALAFTDAGVLWVHHRGGSVAALYVATTDGPPPLDVQAEVADLIYSWFG